jgi:hypothetical protein
MIKVSYLIIMFVFVTPIHAFGWSATFYGDFDDPNKDVLENGTGACWKARSYGICYGKCFENIAEPKLVAAINTRQGENTRLIGKCFKVHCTKGSKRGFPWSTFGLWDPCKTEEPIEVMITDSCPCGKNNDNLRHCCGPHRHLDLSKWAFEKIADEKWGVIDITAQEVPCTDPSGAMYGVTLKNCCGWKTTKQCLV